jgi:hypothetical protein
LRNMHLFGLKEEIPYPMVGRFLRKHVLTNVKVLPK